MGTFYIEIVKPLVKIVTVSAESKEDALRIAEEIYKNGEIVLDDAGYSISVL